MALTIQERLKDLRVERGLTLEQLAEQTQLSKLFPIFTRYVLKPVCMWLWLIGVSENKRSERR